MGLTQKEVAAILGITYPALWSRIKHGKPDIHLVIYALSHYYNKDDNLGERDL